MKTLLTIAVACALSLSAFGQGQVAFANTTTTLFTTNGSLLGQGTGNTTGLNQYRIGLYAAPDGTTDESLFTLIAVATNRTSPFNGLFSYPVNPLTIAGNNGTPIAFQVRVWQTSFGASYEQAVKNSCGAFPATTPYFGRSPIGRVTPAVGGAPVPSLFGPGDYPGQLTSGIVLSYLASGEFCFCPPRFFAMRAGDSNVTLRVERGPSGDFCHYQIEAAGSVSGPWTNLNATFTLPGSGVREISDTNPPAPRFYRVRVMN